MKYEAVKQRAYSLAALRTQARRVLPVFDFAGGGAERERTQRWNEEASGGFPKGQEARPYTTVQYRGAATYTSGMQYLYLWHAAPIPLSQGLRRAPLLGFPTRLRKGCGSVAVGPARGSTTIQDDQASCGLVGKGQARTTA